MRPQNHPQQVAKRGAMDDVDTRITPRALWRQLDHEFGFTLDAAAAADNAKTARFFDRATNGLEQRWGSERVWCNPPFSDIGAWVLKAWEEHCLGCPLIVLLTPSNRTEQPWWQTHIEPHRDGRGPIETRFLPGRVDFHAKQFAEAKAEGSRKRPPFGCVVLIWRPM